MKPPTQQTLLIITGPPCAGKTSVARELANLLDWPLMTKDDIKEQLFDTLGWDDRKWSSRLSVASYDILFHIMKAETRARRSIIVEANFKPAIHNEAFSSLRSQKNPSLVQAYVTAETGTLIRRLRERATEKTRHPGHCDSSLETEVPESLTDGTYEPLDIEGPTIHIDTTSGAAEDAARRILRKTKKECNISTTGEYTYDKH